MLRSAADLRGGEWFRLHPLTPVLQGGVVLLGLAGAGLAALWETVILRSILVFAGVEEDDELSGIALLIADSLVLVFLGALAVVGVSALVFWFQWRVHVVRMDDDVLEVKKGVIAKSSRRARRDRINTIGVRRPLIPRLLGLAKLDIQAAGSDANVVLAYLPYSVATAVRREILQTPKATDDESEPDPQVVTRELEVSLFRYLASLVVSVETIFFGAGFVGTIIAALTAEELVA
ncbi:MAG: PH domain-containing protein, partial [Actinobacteria bacterium]|nr:PH domain-containing protein [Actinomycetota bacterium]